MNTTLLLIRLALATVFAVAGVGKILDPQGSRRSLREFGVPRAFVATLAALLPLSELVCAVALVIGASAWWGALGAAALLTLFIAAITVNLARGRTPDCHCFGKLHSEPVGWWTVVRNVGLASLAGFILWRGSDHAGPGLFSWLASLNRIEALFLAFALALVGLTVFGLTMLYQVLAQNGRLMLRVEALEAKMGAQAEPIAEPVGIPAGSPAPTFILPSLDGIPVALETLRELERPVLLVFSAPGCDACDELLPEVARWQKDHRERLFVALVGQGDVHVNRAKSIRHRLEHVLIQNEREVAEAYQVQATPSAVLIEEGKIAAPLAAGADAIRTLVFNATLPLPVKKGDLAPALELNDLDRKPLNVGSVRRTVLLFWNPSCSFCGAMLKDLQSWERTRSKRAPSLIVVSAGTVESDREQRFRSRVLLDPNFAAGKVFGATGTPSAVLIDEEGRIASEVGVGAPAVLALIGAPLEQPATA